MSAAARKSDEIQTAVLDGNGVRAALQGFFGIMDLWGVGNDEARVILGAPSQSTFFAWRRGDNARPRRTPCAASAMWPASSRRFRSPTPTLAWRTAGSGGPTASSAARRRWAA